MKETIKNTVNSTVYNKILRWIIYDETGRCRICPPHKGCNSRYSRFGGRRQKNWKYYRKTQWK